MNTRDEAMKVLISEMLGDLGTLRSQIEALPEVLQTGLTDASKRAETAAISIQRATDALIVAGTRHQSAINEYIEQDALPRINRAADRALSQIAASCEGVSDTTKKAPREPAQDAPGTLALASDSSPGNRASWWVAIGFFIGTVAGMAGTIAWLRPT